MYANHCTYIFQGTQRQIPRRNLWYFSAKCLQELIRICKGFAVFPEETPYSWKKCVTTECKDPVRIKIRNIKELARLSSKSFKDPFRIHRSNNEKTFSRSVQEAIGYFLYPTPANLQITLAQHKFTRLELTNALRWLCQDRCRII